MFANMTSQLNPPHKYTPWITINGEVSYIYIISECVLKIAIASYFPTA